MSENTKTSLVMEGGAMKGLFTCGVIDVMMERGLTFDGAIGVSAGVAFGINYKSHQIGRPLRYNKRFCRDKRYASARNFLRTGDVFDVEFCYHTLPEELDVWDVKAFRENPMDFYCVATDVTTGGPVYHLCNQGMEDIDWIRASASIPILSRVVETDGCKLLDGGISDAIPLSYMQKLGYDKHVVILTKPMGYRLKPIGLGLRLLGRIYLRHYPKMREAMKNRHVVYNRNLDEILREEAAGRCFVIRPPKPLNIKSIVHDPAELDRVYQIGREEMERQWEKMMEYLQE